MPPHRRTSSRSRVPPPYNDAARGERLQKVMANLGVAARRDCETLISDGRVTVNGVRIGELPAWVDPARDQIEVDGEPVARPSRKRGVTAGHTYLLLNKPRRVISTVTDPEGRRTVLDLIDAPSLRSARLYPVGRLDADSTGLILLTNDGELANRLTHPRYEVPKRYRVSLRGKLSREDLVRLKQGLLLTHKPPGQSESPRVKRAAMAQVALAGYERDAARGDRTLLDVTLHEGQNREIRRLLARLGFKVRRLHRVGLGPLQLKGLAVGQWRLLTGTELQRLRKAGGLS